MEIQRKIAVIGGGAVGTVLADAIERAGHDVTLCMRNVPPELVLRSGADTRRLAIRMTSDPASVTHCDWVFIVTKAHDTASVAPWLRRLADANSMVVVCQNGIRHRSRVAPLVDGSTIVPAVVSIIAERTGPGQVIHFAGKRLTVANDQNGGALKELMRGSEVEIVLDADIERAVWMKFMGNIAAAPVTTLTGRRMEVLRESAVQELLRDLLREAVKVGVAEGVRLDESDVGAILAALHGIDATATTSMQADRAHGRSLEVDELAGVLDRVAVEHGIDTPVNRTVLALLRALPVPGS